MKILFLGNGLLDADNYPFPNQGGSVQTWGISKEFIKKGHDVYIIKRDFTNKKVVVDGIKLISIDLINIDCQISNSRLMGFNHIVRAICSMFFSIKTIKEIKKINPDVIILIDPFSGLFPSLLNWKKIFIIHSPDAFDFYKSFSIKANILNAIWFYIKKYLTIFVINHTNKVVVLNSFMETYLKKEFYNIVRIPNGICLDQFKNISDDNFILYAGRFDWNKNVTTLVDAFAKVQKSHINYNLVLIGTGPEEEKIRILINEWKLQSYVMISPWLPRKDLIKLMRKCSLFVLPSFFEVFNVVILEAMASSKPVIARSNIGTLDIIFHDHNGFLYTNKEQLEQYLELLLDSKKLRKKIGENARRTIKEKYTFNKIADKYLDLLKDITSDQKNYVVSENVT